MARLLNEQGSPAPSKARLIDCLPRATTTWRQRSRFHERSSILIVIPTVILIVIIIINVM